MQTTLIFLILLDEAEVNPSERREISLSDDFIKHVSGIGSASKLFSTTFSIPEAEYL